MIPPPPRDIISQIRDHDQHDEILPAGYNKLLISRI